MAQEITYSPQVEPEGIPGRAYPRVSDYVPSGAFGGEIGKGLEVAGDVAERHFNAAQAQARQSQLTDAHNQLQQLSLSLSHDPNTGAFTKQGKDAFGLNEQYLPQYDQQAQAIIQGVKDPRARQAAQMAAAQVRNHLQEQLDSHEIQQHKEFGINTAKSSIQLAQQAASSNYNHPDIIATNLDGIDHQVDNLAGQLGMSDAQREELRYTSRAEAHRGVLTSMLADDKVDMAKAYLEHYKGELKPQEVKEAEHAIEAGQVKTTANGIMAGYRQSTDIGANLVSQLEKSGLSPDDQSKVVEQVEHERRALAMQRQQDPATRRTLTALDDSIASRTVTQGAIGTIESLWRHGALTDEQRMVKRDEVLRALRASQDQQAGFDYVKDAYSNGGHLDPVQDKKAVSDFFYQTVPDKPGSPAYNAYAAEVTARVGVMPDPVSSYIRSALVSGQPQEAARAARLADTIDQTNHLSYEYGTDARLRSMAYGINAAAKAGGDPELAVEREREIAQLDPARKKQLDQDWGRQLPHGSTWDQFDTSLIRSSLAQDDHYTTPGTLYGRNAGSVPQIPGGMLGEFNNLAKNYFYLRDGNMKEAQELAMRDLKRVWGVSEVNGERQLMKFAPERLFPNLPLADIRDDLAKEGYGAARLQESRETASSGGRRWSLMEPDEFGFPKKVTDSNGNAVRYQLPQPSKPSTWEREFEANEERMKLNRQRSRENRTAEEGGDIASTRMPHF